VFNLDFIDNLEQEERIWDRRETHRAGLGRPFSVYPSGMVNTALFDKMPLGAEGPKEEVEYEDFS
jgi:hypothetical protein